MKTKCKFAVIIALATGSLNIANAILWPTDENWTALMNGADMYSDAAGDQNPSSVDLIGTTDTFSAGYWALIEDGDISASTTGDAFMFRMRVGGEGGNFAWQAHLDTDGDASNVEWTFQLVQSGKSSSQGVELIKTAVGGTTLEDIDIGNNTSAWLGDASLYSRWSAIDDSTDFHVDFAIPWDAFSTITSVTDPGQIRAVLSTSTTHANINKDILMGAALTDPISTVLSESIPEPAGAPLLLATGSFVFFFRRIFSYD